MISNKELNLLELEGSRHCVCSAFAVLACPQEKRERNSRKFGKSLFAFGAYLYNGVQGVEDRYWEGPHLGGKRVLCILCQNIFPKKKLMEITVLI